VRIGVIYQLFYNRLALTVASSPYESMFAGTGVRVECWRCGVLFWDTAMVHLHAHFSHQNELNTLKKMKVKSESWMGLMLDSSQWIDSSTTKLPPPQTPSLWMNFHALPNALRASEGE